MGDTEGWTIWRNDELKPVDEVIGRAAMLQRMEELWALFGKNDGYWAESESGEQIDGNEGTK